jgi:hypothetical protein
MVLYIHESPNERSLESKLHEIEAKTFYKVRFAATRRSEYIGKLNLLFPSPNMFCEVSTTTAKNTVIILWQFFQIRALNKKIK